MPLTIPSLSVPRPKRPLFSRLRRQSSRPDITNPDLEAQRATDEACAEEAQLPTCPSSSGTSRAGNSDLKIDIPEQQNDGDLPPPAYGDIDNVDEKNVAGAGLSPRAAMDGGDLRSVRSPIIQTATHDNQPTILVLFKEDYVWARAYLKEFDYRKAVRRATARHLYKWYALLIIVITISVLVSTQHTTIVDFCKPVTERIREWPGGWLIPIALLIIVSFPPLVGHEIIGILCGLVWGMWTGFGILAAGTFFGEIATWIVFKWMCTGRARKFERKNKLYAALTQLIRDKSFMFVLILRFSAIPGHIVTAVSASAGANVWAYLAAAFLTLPKQWVITYLGTSFGTHSKKDTYISWAVTIATFIGTIVAAVYVYYQMRLLFRSGRMAEPLPHGDPRLPGGWADVEADGANGVGGGMRVDYEDEGHVRRSVDVIFGPHARRLAAQRSYRPSPLRQGMRAPARTRSLPGPISEDEMREWLAGMDTALVASTGPAEEKAGAVGDLPTSYSQSLLLSPPVAGEAKGAVSPPAAPALVLSDLAHEHIIPDEPSHGSAAPRPASGTVPAILLTPTYTPARSRADSLRGTQSLDLERGSYVPPSSDDAALAAVKRPHVQPTRSRADSTASRKSILLARPRSDSRASLVSTTPRPSPRVSQVVEECHAERCEEERHAEEAQSMMSAGESAGMETGARKYGTQDE